MESETTKALRTLEAKLAAEKLKLKQEATKRAQAEKECAGLAERVEILTAVQDTQKQKARIARASKRKASRKSATAIVCLNDWHIEEEITKESTLGLNEFNLTIAKRRLDKTWAKAQMLVEFARSISRIDKLVVWLGGDLINGNIHEELAETNFLGPTDACVFAEERLVDGLESLKRIPRLKEITVVTSFGNHGRTTPKSRIANGYQHSWEYLIYKSLERLYSKDTKVHFQVAKSYHNLLEVEGKLVRFHHGDHIRYKGGVNGVGVPVRKSIFEWNQSFRADLDVLGHFHQFHCTDLYTLCNCLCGYNAYAMLAVGAKPAPPSQTFMVMDKDYGRVLAMEILCGESV